MTLGVDFGSLVIPGVVVGAVLVVGGGAIGVIRLLSRRRAGRARLGTIEGRDAAGFVWDQLPPTVLGSLGRDAVIEIMSLTLRYLRAAGSTTNGHSPEPAASALVSPADIVEWVLARLQAAGQNPFPADVHAVVGATLDYLQALGLLDPADRRRRRFGPGD